MIRDDAIEEIRERRRKLIKEKYGNSIDRFFDDADAWQKTHPERLAHPKRVKTIEKTTSG